MAYNCQDTLQCYNSMGEPSHVVGPFGGYTSVDTEGNTYCNISVNPALDNNPCGVTGVGEALDSFQRKGRRVGTGISTFRKQSGGMLPNSMTNFYSAGQQAALAAFQAGGVNALLAFLAGFNSASAGS